MIELDVKVVLQNGDDLPAAAADVLVWPGDNFGNALFTRATVRIGTGDVEFTSNYAMRAFSENNCSFTKEAKKATLFASSGWNEDAAWGTEGADTEAEVLAAVLKRKELIAGSAVLSFCLRLRLSIMSSERLLFPGLNLQVRLQRAEASYSLMSATANPAGGARVLITNAVLHARRVIANDALFGAQSDLLISGATAKYPMQRVTVKPYTLEKGSPLATIRLDQKAQQPTRVIVGLTRADAFSGSFELNPFRFQPFDLSLIELQLDGLGEGIKYEPSFPRGSGTAMAYAKFAGLDDAFDNDGKTFGITYDEWRTKSTWYAFDFTGDLVHNGAFHLVRDATMTLRMRFKEQLPCSVVEVVIKEHDELVQIDAQRRVTMIGMAL